MDAKSNLNEQQLGLAFLSRRARISIMVGAQAASFVMAMGLWTMQGTTRSLQ